MTMRVMVRALPGHEVVIDSSDRVCALRSLDADRVVAMRDLRSAITTRVSESDSSVPRMCRLAIRDWPE